MRNAKRQRHRLNKKHEELSAAFEQLTATEEELRQNYDELAKSEHRLLESEHKVRASEAFLKCVISDVREGITALDTDLRYILWNPFMEELTGIPAADVIGKRLTERFPSLQDTDLPGLLGCALAGEITETPDIPLDLSIKKKRIWVRGIASPLYDPDGKITGVITVVQDITARKEMELALLATAGNSGRARRITRMFLKRKTIPSALSIQRPWRSST